MSVSVLTIAPLYMGLSHGNDFAALLWALPAQAQDEGRAEALAMAREILLDQDNLDDQPSDQESDQE